MTSVYLALGGNLGAVEHSFDLAIDRLASLPDSTVASVSSIYRFPAVGKNAGSEFRNAAVELKTSLDPIDLLDRLQQIENDFGRVRDVRWGPRPLDLDMVFFGDRVIDQSRLRVPHPACWYRRFVLDPLSEIAHSVVHPEKGVTVGALRERLLVRPLPVEVSGGNVEDRSQLISQLAGEYPDVSFRHSLDRFNDKVALSGSAILVWLGADSRSESVDFDQLPIIPRLDVSAVGCDRVEFVRDVLNAALAR